jgi:acid phosphatase
MLPTAQKIKTILENPIKTFSTPAINSVVIIMMENKSYSDIVGSPNAPYINSLIHKYSFANNYFAVSHPSLPNYLAIAGGSTFGITSDCTDCYVNSVNLVDQLEQTHKTWKAYMESIPSSCFIGSSGEYAQKHNPFIYFDNIRNNPKRCQNIVPYTQLKSDFQSIQTTPNFAWVSPNLCNDMHDCSINTGDMWLSSNVPNILNSPAFTQRKSLLIITWDEGEGSGNNQIPTLLIGNTVKKSYVSHTFYTHYSLLHTIENEWNISPLTMNVSQSAVISDVFTTNSKR